MNRVEIVRKLIDERFGGNQSAFARAIGKTPTHIYQWLNGIRNIGDGTARQIEKALGLPNDYLFNPSEKMKLIKELEEPEIKFCLDFGVSDNFETKKEDKYITFSALDLCGIQTITVLREWAVEQFGNNLSTIRVLTMNSDSMSGTIEDGSVLFVDESVRYFNGDGVYVLLTPDGLKIKRLQITVSGSLNVISDNPRYPIETVPKEEIDTIQICGKVKGCWQMKRL